MVLPAQTDIGAYEIPSSNDFGCAGCFQGLNLSHEAHEDFLLSPKTYSIPTGNCMPRP